MGAMSNMKNESNQGIYPNWSSYQLVNWKYNENRKWEQMGGTL
jgi:hypothetical protein